MPGIRRVIAIVATLAASLLLRTGPAHGQASIAPARRCDHPDTTASWYRRQQEWWTLDTKRDWTNDSVRTALIHAAHALEPARTTPFPLQPGALIVSPDAHPHDQRS